jgi:hypothetical protein
MTISPSTKNKNVELASWLPFLGDLHHKEWELQRLEYYNYRLVNRNIREQRQLVGPAIRLRETSWNTMCPDIERPVAVTTVSNIATMARRLGMSWRAFRPEDGIMRAEGNGHVLSSTLARSIGIVLRYHHVGGLTPSSSSTYPNAKPSSGAELYIPTREADMMAFGKLPGCDGLKIPSFGLGTFEDVLASMESLDCTGKAIETLSNTKTLLTGKWDAHYTRGFSDIISLAAPMLRHRGSFVVRLPAPMKHCFGLTCYREGLIVFYNRLKQYITQREFRTVPSQIFWVLRQCESLQAAFPTEWESDFQANEQSNTRPLAFIDAVHTVWDVATTYFINLHTTGQLHNFDLMASHIPHAVNYWPNAWTHIRDGTTRNHYGLRSVEAEGMRMYFDYLPSIVEDMRQRSFEGKDELVHEAWFVMMFRAFCWWRCHFLEREKDEHYEAWVLPARYWNCELPVYIE